MAEPALSVRDLRARRGGREVLGGVSFELDKGEVLALIGPNGAGKSTLLRAVLGLAPAEGEVVVEGRRIERLSPRERARTLAYVPQQGLLETAFSVEQVVRQGRYAHAPAREADRDGELVLWAMRTARVEALATRAFTELSHGERRRVLLARALATGARVIALDEPDAFLDVGQALALFALLGDLAGEGFAILVVLHGLDDVAHVASRALLLNHGAVVADGAPAEVLSAEHLEEVYGVRPRGEARRPFELAEASPPPPPPTLDDAPGRTTSRRRNTSAWNVGALALALGLGALAVPRSGEAPAAPSEGERGEEDGAVLDRTGARFAARRYERIVSASATADQILAELVSPRRVLATSAYGRALEPVSHRFAGYAEVGDLTDVESIVALEPDLVLVHDFMRADVVARLREAGVPIFDLGVPSGAAAFARDLRTLDALLRLEGRGRAYAARYLARLDGVAPGRPTASSPSALYVRVIGGSIHGGASGTSYHDVIRYAGLRDAAAGEHAGFPTYDPEEIVTLDPDFLVTHEGAAGGLCARAGLDALRACRQGRVVELPVALLDDAGLGIEEAARLLRAAVGRE